MSVTRARTMATRRGPDGRRRRAYRRVFALLPAGCATALLALGVTLLTETRCYAQLPTGYVVWSKGTARQPGTRRIYRMTLPDKTDIQPLTSGEDISSVISPGGKWVAFAKAKLNTGSDYHAFNLWKLYIVSIHGMGQGRKEIKIDDDGYWPSWGSDKVLYYNQADGHHTRIIRVELDDRGRVGKRETFFSSKDHFSSIREVNEAVVAPDGSWFAARTRSSGDSANGVGSFLVSPPQFSILARAGSIGCMPYMAPSSKWAVIAGADKGIRWGDSPGTADGKQDQVLLPAISKDHKAYHPSISTDEQWVLASHGKDWNHNSDEYDVYLYKLDPEARTVGEKQPLAVGDFNGWPHLWVGAPSAPPPPMPEIEDFHPNSYTVLKGDSVLFAWQTASASEVWLDGETVGTSGFKAYAVEQTKDFELSAGNEFTEERAKHMVRITVHDTPRPVVIEEFALDSATLEAGKTAQLSWKVANATTLSIGDDAVEPVGTMEISPLASRDYTLTAKGHQGPASQTVNVKVQEIIPEGLPPLESQGGFLCELAPGQNAVPRAPFLSLLIGMIWLAVRRHRRRR